MTTYTTRTLAVEVLGDDTKASTRTLRKFLRDTLGEGHAVVGKGGRYSLDYTKPQLRKLIKDFAAWQAQQEEEKAKRAELRNAAKPAEEPETDTTDDEVIEDDADESLDAVEGPTDEEIAEMLSTED